MLERSFGRHRKEVYGISLLVIFWGGSLAISGCRRGLESFDLTYDLMRDIAARIPEETQEIDFRKDAKPQEFLLHGWLVPQENHAWAQGKSCRLLFYRYDLENDLEVEAVCRTLPSKDGERQLVSVFLNGNSSGSFVPDSKAFRPVRMLLPCSGLMAGRNVLEFRSSYTSKPSDIKGGSKDTRDLSLAFQKIAFGQYLSHFNDQGLRQRSGSSFIAFGRLPRRLELVIQYKNQGDTTSSIALTSESNHEMLIALPPKKSRYKKKIQLKEEGLYELRFCTKGRPGSHAIWSQIEVRVPKRSPDSPKKRGSIPHPQKPDILLYVVDALRADHLGCYGYGRETSPNIDAFGRENTIFLNAYSNASWTKPSGASLLTGLHPKHHKTMKRDERLPDEVVTLAERLRQVGYHTVAFVGNGNLSHVFGFDQGFDSYYEFFDKYPYSQHVPSAVINKKVFEFLAEYLRREERPPLFMLIWTVDPHDPYAPEKSVKDLFDISRYTPIDTYDPRLLNKIRAGQLGPTPSQIEYMKTRYDQEIYLNDMSFGELVTSLKSWGIYDNSAVIFTSDHGEEFFEHGGVTHGLTLYNEQIKIPFLIKMPELEKKVHQERVQLFDIYPTILEMLRVQPPYVVDGISFLNDLDPDRTLYFEEELQLNDLNAVLDGDKKLIYNRHSYRPPLFESIPALELFDHDDAYELDRLPFGGYLDQLRLQELFSFRNHRDKSGIERKPAQIPKELDERLRAFGYIR